MALKILPNDFYLMMLNCLKLFCFEQQSMDKKRLRKNLMQSKFINLFLSKLLWLSKKQFGKKCRKVAWSRKLLMSQQLTHRKTAMIVPADTQTVSYLVQNQAFKSLPKDLPS